MKEVREAVGLVNQYSNTTNHQILPNKEGVITIDEFGRVEMRVGKVMEAVNLENSEKLIKLTVDFGDETRTILTGVRGFGYTPEDFAGKQFFFVTNLAPRRMMGEESQGMILAASNAAGAVDPTDKPLFVSAEGMPVGAKIR